MPEMVSSKEVSLRFGVNMSRAAKAIRDCAQCMGRPDAVHKSESKGTRNRIYIDAEVFEAWIDLVGELSAGEPVHTPDMTIPIQDPHLPRFVYGSGDRREDCARYTTCLDRFLADHERRCGSKHRTVEPQGQCPVGCQHYRLRCHQTDREIAYAYSMGEGYMP